MGRPAILKVDIVADAKGVGPGVSEAESRFTKLGSAARKVGKFAAAGLAVAGGAAVAYAGKAIGAASRTQQAYGALETIYGRHARKVKEWANNAASSVGLARSQYSELAALVGSQLQNMGLSQEKSARQSDALIKKGADLAATYGGTVADAVAAVSSLMKGEADPIERYGVSIKRADVTARLAAEGLDKLEGKAKKQAEAQALLSLLNEQTAKTTGAFARESNTLAGQQERLKAKYENLTDTLGQKLIPVATKVVTWVSDKMLPGAQRLGRVLADRLGPGFDRVGGFITEKVIPAAQGFHAWFVEKIAPGIRRTVTPVLDGVRSLIGRITDRVNDNSGSLGKLWGWFKKLAEFIADKVLPIIGEKLGFELKILGVIIGGVIDVVSALVEWIDKAVTAVGNLIDWIGKIDVPDIKLPGFLTGAATLTIGRVDLTGAAADLDRRLSARYTYAGSSQGLATGAAGAGGSWSVITANGGAVPAGTVTYVDQRNLSTPITFEGAGLVDELAIAQRLEGILTRHRQRMGQISLTGVIP